MNRLITSLALLFFAAALVGSVSAQTAITDLQAWVPAIMAAVALGILLAGVYYMMGVVLNSKKVKSAAIAEFGQVFTTVLAVMIIISVLYMYAGMSQDLIPQATLNGFCNGFGSDTNPLSALVIIYGQPTSTICSQYSGGGVNYGLDASYIITANLLQQDAANLNAMYVFQSYLGFLEKFTPQVGVCAPFDCQSFPELRVFSLQITDAPLAGYALLRNVARPLEGEAIVSYYSLTLQLIVILLIINAWPWIIAAGLILRVTIFGRRVGGLLIGIAVAAIIILPLMMTLEYTTLTSGTVAPIGLGSQTLPNPAANGPGSDIPAPDRVNFYSFPNAQKIISDDGCWPYGGSVPLMELNYAAFYLIPGTGIYSTLTTFFGGFIGSEPQLPAFVGNGCNSPAAINTLLNLVNVYGIMMVSCFLLPILNVLITLSAAKGLSSLLGGDTEMAGLGKLV